MCPGRAAAVGWRWEHGGRADHTGVQAVEPLSGGAEFRSDPTESLEAPPLPPEPWEDKQLRAS